ncbi:MAG: DNA topoisomerase [Sphingomonas sp. 28-66-16]|nr:MAG: DNA topoisomerase [Sphingomonas sp. 28-66-16]
MAATRPSPRLCLSDDRAPGITRRKLKHGWSYWSPEGERITDRDKIDRLDAIGLPPAYRDAWFCPSPAGHIQAVGWDDKGRKQYRYHARFRDRRDALKYARCAEFGRALPKLRARVEADLARPDMSRERAVAAVVRLLDCAQVRVGNEDYARANNSYGATTLRKQHARLRGSRFELSFQAKSGKHRELTISDRALTRFVRKSHALPGQTLFGWIDDEGVARAVTSADVNAYIRDAMGADFTAKHFRTWWASVLAFEALAGAEGDISMKAMLEPVAEALGNTPTIARNSYVHPRLINLAKKGQSVFRRKLVLPRRTRHLGRLERALIDLLDRKRSPTAPSA